MGKEAAKIQRSDRQVERAQRSLREAKVIERVGGKLVVEVDEALA